MLVDCRGRKVRLFALLQQPRLPFGSRQRHYLARRRLRRVVEKDLQTLDFVQVFCYTGKAEIKDGPLRHKPRPIPDGDLLHVADQLFVLFHLRVDV